MLVSAVQQSESVLYINTHTHTHTHTHTPSFLDFLSISVITEHWVEFPVLYSRFSLVIYFIYVLSHSVMPIPCDPIDYSLPGSSVHGILQARILEWVAMQPGDLPNPGIKPRSPTLQADSLPSEPQGKPVLYIVVYIMSIPIPNHPAPTPTPLFSPWYP